MKRERIMSNIGSSSIFFVTKKTIFLILRAKLGNFTSFRKSIKGTNQYSVT